ncbi:MAG: DoxX family protein [Bacteroidetes bacterium]|nr:DoxX family protein [Rhodothermia bacterium]MCS7155735.1 DoxX family protein [Bacteroidota bacterium]MCX7906164.1 DoxX family protein [Bacteroidota bacterium]MDW8138292.1 DoxX family protein [Bacteroidota bacterium]MDW8285976.1 DoxX family protein [Bacteroidota bacterium]
MTLMELLFVLGRVLFGGFFVLNGINHFTRQATLVEYAASRGVPAATFAVSATGGMILLGGFSVMFGIVPQFGLILIMIFLVPVTLKMHAFWHIDDPGLRLVEQSNFYKNLALLGAALMLITHNDWAFSINFLRF